MTDIEVDALPAPNEFPVHIPSNEAEARLIEIQDGTDELGIALFRRLIFDVGADIKIEQDALKKSQYAAGILLRDQPLDYKDGGFFARYLYEHRPSGGDVFPRLIYPADSLHHSAYIKGEVEEVVPVAVEHPSMDRQGPAGYRLCAEVNATRVMGWSSRENAKKFYIPIGEILLAEVPYDQSMVEVLEPSMAAGGLLG